METTQQKVTTFADFRLLQRQAGLLAADDTHHIFAMTDDGRMEEIGHHGDIYEAVTAVMAKVMLDKLPIIAETSGIVIEAQIAVPKCGKVPNEITPEEAMNLERADAILTIAHDGEKIAAAVRPANTDNAPDELPTDDEFGDSNTGGQLAEAIESLTLGILLARKFIERGKPKN